MTFPTRALLLLALALGSRVASAQVNLRDAWQPPASVLAGAARPGAGFSFAYGGKVFGPEFSGEWRQSTVRAGSDVSITTLTHHSGLVVKRETRVMRDFNAVEYKVSFRNATTKVLPPLSVVKSLDVSFKGAFADGGCVVSSGGGTAEAFLPPKTLAIRKACFAPTVPDNVTVDLATEGGRSSNKDLPFFFIHQDAAEEGVFVAFWSGQWSVAVGREGASGTLSIQGKIPDLEIALQPGEEIQGPVVLLGLYAGNLAEGSNRLRRLIRDVYTPKLSGETYLPVTLYSTWFNIGEEFDEALLKKLVDGAAALGQEYFELDASWYAGASKEQKFSNGLGNWSEVDKNKLPHGLKPIADYARGKNLEFGLWFEPERVSPTSSLAKDHPEWVLWKRDKEPETMFRDWNQGLGLLDYGRPEVQAWVKSLLDRYITDYGVRYIRYDFNMDPLPYWDADDSPGRRGMTQLRHVQGLYSILDWIRERHPQTVLEGCASGGRRMDLETARRFHTFMISDHTRDPAIIRFHLFGIHHFLPGNYHWIAYTLPVRHQKEFRADDLDFQSLFGGAFGTSGRIDLWPEEMKSRARMHIGVWKQLRRYLLEDYYPLSPQPADLESWSGWQFQDPKDQSGFVQTFRTRTTDRAHRFKLHRLDAKARYRFTDAYTGEAFTMEGARAMIEGIEVLQQPMSSRVLTYAVEASPADPNQTPSLQWYRCNTHTHTNAFPGSDANASPAFAAEWYRKQGYQCLFITDHEHVTDVSAVNRRYEESGAFLVMTGEEISQALTDAKSKLGMRFYHLNGLGISKVIASVPRGTADLTPADIYKKHIDATYAAGGIPQINHPNLQWSVAPEDLLPITRPFLLEIWNAFPTSNNLGGTDARGDAALSTEALWDRLLTSGQVVWGTASDDTHDYENFERREETPTPGKAWIVIKAPALNQGDILRAIARGSFYASTGVKLESYEADSIGISMKIAQVPDWNPKLEGSARFVTRFIGAGGRLLAEVMGDTPRYRFKGNERYVRATILDSDGRRGWTQPVFLDGRKGALP